MKHGKKRFGMAGRMCAVLAVAAWVLLSANALAVKVRTGDEKPRESGTLITIETLEKISSGAATGTVEVGTATDTEQIGAATDTKKIGSATGTTEMETAAADGQAATATQTAEAPVETATLSDAPEVKAEQEETPAAEPESGEEDGAEVPPAERSLRYDRYKHAAVTGEPVPAAEPAIAEEQPEPIPVAEPPVAEKQPETITAPEKAEPAQPQAETAAKTAEPEAAPEPETPAVAETAEEPAEPEPAETQEVTAEKQAPATEAETETAESAETPAPAAQEEPAPEKAEAETQETEPQAAQTIPPAPEPAAPVEKEVITTEAQKAEAETAPAPESAAEEKSADTKAAAPEPETSEEQPAQAEKPAEPEKQPEQEKKAETEKATPPEAKPAAPAPAAVKAESASGKYIVRSGPITDPAERDALAARMKDSGYYPSIVEETAPGQAAGGDKKYYFIEMGRLEDISLASQLLVRVREVSDDFFIVGDGVKGGQGLVPSGSLSKVIPHRAGEGGDDSMALLSDVAGSMGRKTVAGGETRREQKPQSPQTVETVVLVQGDPSKLETSKRMLLLKEEKPVKLTLTGEDRRLRLKSKMRELAWEMRAGGYDVEVENDDDQFVEPEGILVGLFDSEEEAVKLAAELNEYGYGVNVVHRALIDGMYYVYADTTGDLRDITIIDPVRIADHMVSDDFDPPPDPAADALLNLMNSK